MKVICKFDLDDEDDTFKYNAALRATNMFHALTEYGEWLRQVTKHQDPAQTDASVCKLKFWEILKDNAVDLEI